MAESKYVVFSLGEERYGVPIERVERIMNVQPITKIPRAPKMMKGVFELRGDMVPVMDARERFEMPVNKEARNFVVVLAEAGRCALLVDGVQGIIAFEEGEVEARPATVASKEDDFLSGIGRKDDVLTVLLNPDHLIPEAMKAKLAS